MHHTVFDPIRNQYLYNQGYYGQTMGKSAIRTGIPAKPKTVHKFTDLDGSPLKSMGRGYLLHYYAYDFEDFIKKYRNFEHRPNTYLSGSSIETIKQMWRDLVNNPDMSLDTLQDYYTRWILFSHHEIAQLSRDRILGLIPKDPAIIQVNAVKGFLSE